MPDDIETLSYKDDAPQEEAKPKEKIEGVGQSAEKGEGDDKGFWDGLRDKLGATTEETNEGLKKATKKIAVKLNKIGRLFGESEQFVYYKTGLNKLMKPEEIEAEKVEITEDINILIETRIKIVSKFADVINVITDVVSHVVTRAYRFYSMSPKDQDKFVEEQAPKQEPSNEGLDPKTVEMARYLNITYEQAKTLKDQGLYG